MKKSVFFTLLLMATTSVNMALAAIAHYDVTLVFTDDTTFRGSFDYDPTSQQISNLQGVLDDVLMGNMESLGYQLAAESDGKGGITAHAFELNTTAIGTNPPINNNASVAINFNATNPTLGSTNPAQLSYMDCSPLALMGQTCMYYLSWHNPVVPMEGGHGVLSETITTTAQISRPDCLFDWAETNYPQLFSPAGSTSQTWSSYYYRYYPHTNSYVGISSVDEHVYYLGPDGNMQDVGQLSDWLTRAGC